jgi:outer membrane cobalamin receptor
LEGASPFLVNGDLSYNYTAGDTSITTSLVVSYFSDRVQTLGTSANDIIEEGVATLSFVSSFKVNKHFTLKLKAGNLLNQPHRFTRRLKNSAEKIVLNEYRKGIDVSLGLSLDF